MLTIKGNTITLTRGDTARIQLDITQGGEAYDYSDDTVLFTVKRSVKDEEYLIQKTVSDGVITILPEDTESLKYGVYVYDVQVTTQGGDVCTVITPSQLVIDKEVTWDAQD